MVINKHNDKYELTCAYGILDYHYRADNLQLYHWLMEFEATTITNKISIRAACGLSADRTKHLSEIEAECDCIGKCLDNRCKLKKKQFKMQFTLSY